MQQHYKKIRDKVFTTTFEANFFLFHIIYLLLLIAYPIAVEELRFPLAVFTILLTLFIIISMFLSQRLNYIIVTAGVVSIFYLLYYLEAHYDHSSIHYLIKSILLFSFSLVLFISLAKGLLQSEISLRLLYQGIDCYLLLGVCFAFLFRIMHFINPTSFNFDLTEDFNHLYLSFIVLTSIGLGDLLPTSTSAKAVVVLNGILGQIYIVFFAALIVGKFLTKSITTK